MADMGGKGQRRSTSKDNSTDFGKQFEELVLEVRNMQTLYLKPVLETNARVLDQLAIMKDNIEKNRLDIEKFRGDLQKLEESSSALAAQPPPVEEMIQESSKRIQNAKRLNVKNVANQNEIEDVFKEILGIDLGITEVIDLP